MPLLPEPITIRALLDEKGLTGHVVALSAKNKYKTSVIVKNLCAARTGAELTNLMMEAGHADPAITRDRVNRISDGLEVFLGPAMTDKMLSGLAETAMTTTGVPWLEELQVRHGVITEEISGMKNHPQLPLVLAGVWLQASWLTASALEESGNVEDAHALLYRPEIGTYFRSYVHTRGKEDFPQSVLNSLEKTLDVMDTRTAKDPMTTADITIVRKSVQGLLHSM